MTSDCLLRASTALVVVWAILLGGPSCTKHVDGVEAMVGLQSEPTPAAFDTDLGYHVELGSVYLDFASTELLPCSSVRWIDLLGPPRARAHTGSSPTLLGVPQVVELIATVGQVEHIGTLEPPIGDYCGVRAGIEPADADAVGLPTEVDMVGLTVRLAGTLTPPGGSPRAFVVSSAGGFEHDLSFAAPVTLDLHHALLSVVVHTDHTHWLDGIDFDSLDANAQADALLANVQSSLTITSDLL